MDGEHYRPAPSVMDRLRKVTFVAVVGPTAVGKSTLTNRAMAAEPSLHYVKGETSRAPRPGERDGQDYHFRTNDEMMARIRKGSYVQVAPQVLGALYATAPEDYSTEGIAIYSVISQAIPDFRALPFKKMRTIFVVPPDWEAWQARVTQHGFTAEQLKSRMTEAKESLEFALEDKDSQFVINADLDIAARDFVTLALGKPRPARLKADQTRARTIVRELLSLLSNRT